MCHRMCSISLSYRQKWGDEDISSCVSSYRQLFAMDILSASLTMHVVLYPIIFSGIYLTVIIYIACPPVSFIV